MAQEVGRCLSRLADHPPLRKWQAGQSQETNQNKPSQSRFPTKSHQNPSTHSAGPAQRHHPTIASSNMSQQELTTGKKTSSGWDTLPASQRFAGGLTFRLVTELLEGAPCFYLKDTSLLRTPVKSHLCLQCAVSKAGAQEPYQRPLRAKHRACAAKSKWGPARDP